MISSALSAEYLDDLYARWREAPGSLSPEWRAFFEGFELAGRPAAPPADAAGLQARAEALLHRYRDLGHLMACLDPLAPCLTTHPLLEPSAVGATEEDLGREVLAPGLLPGGRGPLGEAVAALRETYCGALGVEYLHVQDPEEREWLRGLMEPSRNRPELAAADRWRALELLTRAGRFEEFLQRRYPGQTRFSLEGGEGTLVLLDEVLRRAAEAGAREAVLAMAHRGRLTTQVVLLGKPLREAFCEFEATYDPDTLPGGGDVKYHSGYLADVEVGGGRRLRVLMPENPSHLEAVNPVAEGIARARQERWGAEGPARVLPLLLHGDSSISGQGIVAETLNLSRLPGYATGGTVHVVLNNQIGFTTPPEHARSTRYATDVAKMLMVPIFHVQGEEPEALIQAARLAVAYRNRYAKDVVVDVVCYRRYGHNEGDEPYFTQPLLYGRIRGRPPAGELYARRLAEPEAAGRAEALRDAADRELESAHGEARSQACRWPLPPAWEGWEGIGAYGRGPVETAVAEDRLRALLGRLSTPPEGFSLHPTLQRVLGRRLEATTSGRGLDWAAAEALAFGTLVTEGVAVRLSGEDSRRGTFSQRHAAWFDTATGAEHVPLASLAPDQAPFEAFDSALSEAGVLGFEYGYAAANPEALVLWEAQYGDFANGAQVIVDEFVASGEAKWRRRAGLVMLLPHGYEGQGPDHSTARPERFLELCAADNLQVCWPSTPAQAFHLLRRQAKAPWRKPLVVFTPKSLLRHPAAVSPLGDLAAGGFREVLPDPSEPSAPPRKVLLCSGKVFYDLDAARRERGLADVALVRLEQLYPFPAEALEALAERYGPGPAWLWVQEEPKNLGAWPFLQGRLAAALGAGVRCVGRPEAASPATGFPLIHRQEQAALVAEALA